MFNFLNGIMDKVKENAPAVKRIRKAAELMESGQFEPACELLERSKKTSSGTLKAGVCFLHGVALYQWSKEVSESSAAMEMLERACSNHKQASKLCSSKLKELHFSIEYEWANAIAEYGRRIKSPENMKHYLQAIEKYRAAENILANQPEVYNGWGNVLYDMAADQPVADRQKTLDEACEKFQRGLALDKKSASLHSNWGRVLFCQAMQSNDIQLFHQSIERFQDALGCDPDFQNAVAGMGAACSELVLRCPDWQAKTYFEKSRLYLEKAIQLKPRDDESLYNLAYLYCEYGKRGVDPASFDDLMEKGADYARKSVEVNEENAEGYLVWGNVLLEQSFRLDGVEKRKLLLDAHFKFEDAMKYRSGFTQAHVNQGTVFLNLAKVCEAAMKAEMLQKSCEHYRTSIQLEPEIGIPNASNNLLIGLFRLSELVQGEEKHRTLDEAISMYETMPTVQIGPWAYNVACAYMLKEDQENVKKWLLIGEKENALETRQNAMRDPDMQPVWSEDWFQKIRWKGE